MCVCHIRHSRRSCKSQWSSLIVPHVKSLNALKSIRAVLRMEQPHQVHIGILALASISNWTMLEPLCSSDFCCYYQSTSQRANCFRLVTMAHWKMMLLQVVLLLTAMKYIIVLLLLHVRQCTKRVLKNFADAKRLKRDWRSKSVSARRRTPSRARRRSYSLCNAARLVAAHGGPEVRINKFDVVPREGACIKYGTRNLFDRLKQTLLANEREMDG
jgi:hypothetical protein